MSSPEGSLPEGRHSEVTPAATLRAPQAAALKLSNSKAADKAAMKDFFLVPEWWTLAGLESMDKSRHGTAVSLIHSTLRMVFGDHGVDWQSFLRGGLLGKAMTAAEQARLAKGKKPVAPPGKALHCTRLHFLACLKSIRGLLQRSVVLCIAVSRKCCL
jgi:hypothetical protein